MSKRDYYEVLGIERGADQKEVKKAYRRLPRSFTRTAIRMMKPRSRSSKRSPRPTRC